MQKNPHLGQRKSRTPGLGGIFRSRAIPHPAIIPEIQNSLLGTLRNPRMFKSSRPRWRKRGAKPKFPKFLTRNGHSRKIPTLILGSAPIPSSGKLRDIPESPLPIDSPWECAAFSKLPKLLQISGVPGKLPSPGMDSRATGIVGFALRG